MPRALSESMRNLGAGAGAAGRNLSTVVPVLSQGTQAPALARRQVRTTVIVMVPRPRPVATPTMAWMPRRESFTGIPSFERRSQGLEGGAAWS